MVTVDHAEDPENDARVRRLEAEAGALRARLEQREAVLRALNRRLFELERGTNGTSDTERAQTAAVLQRNEHLEEELAAFRQTKLYRWAAPARSVYGILRKQP